ncbi:MAG: hypothetical protein WED00_11160 [Aquisalimonadaceae bacterium]
MMVAYATVGILLALLVLAHQRHSAPGHGEIIRYGARQLIPLLLRIPPALLAGSFLAALVPEAVVASLLGDASGLGGILIASALGAALPGGPMITFPLALALISAGVGMPQMVALITAWSVLAFHRVIAFELPALGWRLTGIRLLSSLLLPPCAGLLTWAAIALLP